jgi:hypothetical protein
MQGDEVHKAPAVVFGANWYSPNFPSLQIGATSSHPANERTTSSRDRPSLAQQVPRSAASASDCPNWLIHFLSTRFLLLWPGCDLVVSSTNKLNTLFVPAGDLALTSKRVCANTARRCRVDPKWTNHTTTHHERVLEACTLRGPPPTTTRKHALARDLCVLHPALCGEDAATRRGGRIKERRRECHG